MFHILQDGVEAALEAGLKPDIILQYKHLLLLELHHLKGDTKKKAKGFAAIS